MLQIEVCATSANLGIGFDILGLALNLKNKFTFKKSKEFKYIGFESKFCNADNLVQTSYTYVFELQRKKVIPVEIGFAGEIPVARGLGSSSSLVVAGVFAANYFLGNILSKDELFNICCQIEGHPDNVAPAVYGGFIASYKNENTFQAIRYPVHPDINFIVVIPSYEVSTEEARKVLPKTISYEKCIHNMSRIVNLPYALEKGNINLLQELLKDELHEPYRKELIPEYELVKEICQAHQAVVTISGSGSTLLILSNKLDIIQELKAQNLNCKILSIGEEVKIDGSEENVK